MGIGFFNNFGYIILAYLFIHFLGHFIYGLFDAKEEKPIQAIFLKNTLGILAIVFFYSIIKTHFFTINLVFFILFLFLLLHKKIKWQITSKINFPLIVFQLLMLIFFYSVFYFKYYNPIDKSYHALFSDFPVYASFIERMNAIGLESRFPDYYNNPPIRELYHYGDLWLTAFFAFTFKKNVLAAFYFIMFPLVSLIFYTGILALLNPYKLNYKIVIFSLAFLFLSTLSIFYPKSIPFFTTEWGEFTMLNSPKRTMAGIVLLVGIIFAAEKRHMLAILSLLTIAGIYTISLPMVFVCCSIYISYLFLIKEINIRKSVVLFLPLIFTGFFLIIYMKVCANINLNYFPKEAVSLVNVSSLNFNIYLPTSLKNLVGLIIKLILGSMPYIILLLLS